jgi:hypothetical protein
MPNPRNNFVPHGASFPRSCPTMRQDYQSYPEGPRPIDAKPYARAPLPIAHGAGPCTGSPPDDPRILDGPRGSLDMMELLKD